MTNSSARVAFSTDPTVKISIVQDIKLVQLTVEFCVFIGDEKVTTNENPMPPVQRRYCKYRMH